MDQRIDSGVDRARGTRARRWRLGLAALLIVLAAGYLGISLLIGSGVRSVSDMALQHYPGDRVSALMAFVESERHEIRERNRAIWALGQLGDPRALPVMERHYTGGEADERTELSQYELKKAIALCRGATNISALVWRRGALAAR